MILIEHNRDDYIVCRVSGVFTQRDYGAAILEIENTLGGSKRPLRAMILLEDFRGWDAGAQWDELRFDLKQGGDLGRVAVVGESALEDWGTSLSKPFFGAQVQYFARDEKPAARAWLMEREAVAAE